MPDHPNPVIACIDAGHVEHGGKCVVCTTGWKCATMLDAEDAARARNARMRTRLHNDRSESVYDRPR